MKRLVLSAIAILFVVPQLLGIVDFEARENDSRLYTRFVKQLSEKPLSHVVALEWQNMSPYQDPDNPYVRDHLVGQFIPSVVLTKLGWDWRYSHYTVNQLIRFFIPWMFFLIFSKFLSSSASLFILFAIHFNPIALNYGLRANQEQPLVLAMALAIYGYFNLNRTRGLFSLYLGSLFAFWVKGLAGLVFFPFWGAHSLFKNKVSSKKVFCLVGLAFFLAMSAVLYEFWFRSITGFNFWEAYFKIQVHGKRSVEGAVPFSSLLYYSIRSVGYSLPWVLGSVFLVKKIESKEEGEVISLFSVLSFGAIVVFGYFGRKASRYIFPVYYFFTCLGALGISKRIERKFSQDPINCHLVLYWTVFLIQYFVYCYKGKTYVV